METETDKEKVEENRKVYVLLTETDTKGGEINRKFLDNLKETETEKRLVIMPLYCMYMYARYPLLS